MVAPRPLLAGLALMLAASGATAAAVPVRSGEHPGFTRLVFADDTARSWDVARPAATRVEVTFDGPPPDLDLSGVFDRIPRSRLRDLRAGDGSLRLDLACACAVEVSRIASGHVIIDVLDATVDWRPAAPATPPAPRVETILPIALPAAELKLPVLVKLAAREPGPRRRAGEAYRPEPKPRPAAPQVRILNDRQPRLLVERPPAPITVKAPPACHLEAFARSILVEDPSEALKGLPALSGALLDGEDRFDPSAARALARGYLAAGMGAEAVQALRIAADVSADASAVAAAFDGGPRPREVALDPACGPATTLVALLDANPVESWNRADHRALVELMDALPAARWRDVEPRLRASLALLEADHLMTGLHPPARPHAPAAPPTPSTVLAAGTDAAAVEAAIALLADTNARGTAAPESHLVNAMALRRSLPDGPQAQKLDQTVATALVLARHPAEAIEMARQGSVPPATVLSDALTHLPAVEAAEFAVRLRPMLKDDPSLRRIDDLLADLGLVPPSGRSGGNPVEPAAAVTEVLEAPDPWLARDLAALAAAPEADWTGRNRLADAIVVRNGTELPPTDLARADRVLEDSRALSTLISNLLAEPGS